MADSAIPAVVQRNVAQLEVAVSDLQKHLRLLTSPESMDAIVLLSAADRASYFLSISKATNALFCLHLRTTGQSPEKHGVKTELERASVYHDKVAQAVDRSTAPSRPTSSINVPAANRFIEHAIPDLSEDQKHQVREVSRRGKKRSMTWVRDPNDKSSEVDKKQSVMDAAAAFLAEAAKDLVPIAGTSSDAPTVSVEKQKKRIRQALSEEMKAMIKNREIGYVEMYEYVTVDGGVIVVAFKYLEGESLKYSGEYSRLSRG